MARIGQLTVELSLVAREFNAGLKQAQADAKQLENSIKPLKTTLTDVGTAMTAAGGSVLAAFTAMSIQAANYGDAIRDASIRTGISTEALSGLKFAAEQSGTSFESVSTGLTRLARNATEAATGSKTAAAAFDSIGVSVKDATGHVRPMNDILDDVADKFSRMKDGTEKTSIAIETFGRGGASMIELLNQGSAGLEEFRLQAEKLNLSIGTDAANAADAFNDSLNALKNAQLGLSNSIGQALLPMLTQLVDMATGAVIAFTDFTNAHPELTRAVFALAAGLTGAGGLLLGLAGVLAILPSLTAAFTLLTGPIGLTVLAIGALATAAVAFPEFGGFIVDTLKNVVAAITATLSGLGSLVEAINQVGQRQFSEAWQTIKNAPGLAAAAAQESIDTIDRSINKVSTTIDSFKSAASASAKTLDKELVPALDKTNDAALKAEDAAARLFLTLRNPMKELDISKILPDLNPLIRQVDTVTPRIKEMFEQIPADKTEIDLVNDAVAGLGHTTDWVVTRQAEMYKAIKSDSETAKKALADATEDVKNSAGHVFDDMFIKGESIFTSLTNLLKGGALSLGRAIFEDLAGALLGPIKKAFDDFFSGLLEGVGLKALISGLGQKLGGALSSIIPGGGAASSVVGAATGAGGAATSAGGAASSAAGGASAFAGLGAAAVGGLISGGLSALGSMRLEGTMNAVEANTRYTQIQLKDTMEQILWPMLNHTMFQSEVLTDIKNIVAAQELETQGILNKETGSGAAGPTSFTINVTAPLTIAPQFTVEGGEISTLTIRDRIVPETIKMIDTNVRGYGERLAQIIRDRLDGLTGTQAPVGI